MIGLDDRAVSGERLMGAVREIARTTAVRVVAVISLALLASACGSESPPTAGEIFGEYVRSTEVVGDEFQSDNAQDRMANFASMGTPDDLIGMLMAARPCGASSCARPWPQGDSSTPPGPGMDEAHAFSGPNGKVYERKILVKGENGELELISLYVARKPDGTTALVDSSGERHTGGLTGFRQNNDVLDSGDYMLAPREITTVSGRSEIVVVSGHTPSKWTPWLVGGGIVLLAVAAAWAIVRHVRQNRADPA